MKTRFRVQVVVLVAVCLVLAPMAFAAAAPAEKQIERVGADFDREAHFAQMFALQSRLSSARIDLAAAKPLVIEITPDERRSVREGAMERKMRVGVVKELSIPMSFSAKATVPHQADLHDTFGAVRGNDGGGFEWAGRVSVPKAAGVRIHFTDVNLPEGAELYVYTAAGMAFGPYTGKGPNGTGDFWSNTVSGSDVTIQLHAGASGTPRFTIAGVGHLSDEFAMAKNLLPRLQVKANEPPCSFNADCVVDAACTNLGGAVSTAANAVAHILFASGGFLYICSGGLVADSVTSTNVPYFITANHCISRASEASSMETFFFYKAGTCQSCPDPGAASTTGATISATSKTSDYTLMRLSQNAPSGAAFLGWSSTAIANTNGTPLFRLSHPKGAPQAYSTHVVDTGRGTCRSWPRGNWIYSSDTFGATEGGSSGSPVVNAAGQLVGQLSGGCGFNVNDVCDSASNATVDGAFAAYYSSVASILGSGGGGGCTDADGDGVCASAGDCNDNNASIYPGANDTKGQAGRNGIDNDCDGIIDG